MEEKDCLDIAWKYFQQHAQQRISYFNFFVLFSTILLTGFFTLFFNSSCDITIGMPIEIIESFLAFIFWKIDKRNQHLTHIAEEVIRRIESKSPAIKEYAVFTIEEADRQNEKKEIYPSATAFPWTII